MKIILNFFAHRDPDHRRKRRAVSGQLFLAPLGADMSQITIPSDSNGVSASLSFKDKKGNPANLPGVPAWAMGSDTVLTMTVAPDGLSASFVPTDAAGALGDVAITVTAEGDPIPGVDTIVLSGTITVVAAEAATGDLSFSANP
jgi:hypothetical protein